MTSKFSIKDKAGETAQSRKEPEDLWTNLADEMSALPEPEENL